MHSSHTGDLALPMLPPEARLGHAVPDLHTNLLSMGQLCDAGCTVRFDSTTVSVIFQGTTILHGVRSPDTKLWHVNLPPVPPPEHTALASIGSATPAELVAFAHASLFSPALSTLHTALRKGFITNFPGLSDALLKKYPPQSYAMVKGHLDQTRQNQRSTKPKVPPLPTPPSPNDDAFPSSPADNTKTHHCYIDIMEPTGQIYTVTTVKLHLNSVISTTAARYMTGDLKDFYLNTPMEKKDYAYMRIPVSVIPDSIFQEYNLAQYVSNGYVYVEIRKGMYGLPQAGKIANDRLVKFLEPYGYAPVPVTAGLWRHETKDITFTLVVDDFGVKYTSKEDADHLMTTLKRLYKVSEDWDGARYCGLTLKWDYAAGTCDISMPGYIERALQRFQHPPPTRSQHSPHAWQKPDYGAKTQYAPTPDETPALDASDRNHVQTVLGTLLFYARAVDSTMLATIGTLATQQAKGTEATMRALTQLLNYCATHPDAVIRYHASQMILWIESDASYLTAPKARSRAAGYFYLSDKPTNPDEPPGPNDPPPTPNGAVHVLCQIMREVMSSAAEAELGALFHNAKEGCSLRIALEEMGHPQPPTPLQTDNSTASGIANDSVKQKRSKAIDMRFYWTRDRVRQKQFLIYWKKGILNKADYFSKHHPASHHQAIRSSYLHCPDDRSKNYFECLEEEESQKTVSFHTSTNYSNKNSGEGVLISGLP